MMKRACLLMLLAASCSKPAETKTEAKAEVAPQKEAPAEAAPNDAPRPKPTSRAEAIAYLLGAKWLPNLSPCPADVMPKELVLTSYDPNSCKGDALIGCVERCEANDPQACFAVAFEMQESPGKTNPLSEALFLRACMAGEAGGCTNRTAGRLVERDSDVDECTRVAFRKACDADDAWACAFLTSAVANDSDRKELKSASDKACRLAPGVAPCQAAKRVLDAVRAADTAAVTAPP